MTFRTFERTWWADRRCTVPKAGRRRYDGRHYDTQQEARAACQRDNAERGTDRYAGANRGPRGMCTEFESD